MSSSDAAATATGASGRSWVRLRRASRGGAADYFGITYERLDESDGLCWPCPDVDHPGTPRLFTDRFETPNGRARFHPTPHQDTAEPPTRDFPLLLATGRALAQYQSGNQTRRVSGLCDLAAAPWVELHPSTARRAGVWLREA